MEVGVLEAKNRLSELIERAERGESVVITRHGKPAASLNAIQSRPTRADIDRIFAEVAEAKRDLPKITTEEILEDIREGREERYRRIFDR